MAGEGDRPPRRAGRPRSGTWPSPAPLADVHGPIVHTIYRIGRKNRAVIGNLLRPLGLFPGQEILLMVLWERGACSQADLVDVLGIDHSTASRMLQRLESAGMVERRPSRHDRRVMLARLTDAGRQLRGQIEHVWQELERRSTAHLAEPERELLLRLLQSVEAHLSPGESQADAPAWPDES